MESRQKHLKDQKSRTKDQVPSDFIHHEADTSSFVFLSFLCTEVYSPPCGTAGQPRLCQRRPSSAHP
eukprot:10594675-Karenia_brevis.AAC.1